MKGIYFLFNPVLWKKQPWQESIKKILPYISVIQLRSPELNDRDLYFTAKKLKEILTIPLIINNRLDIAKLIDADGVHLGMGDMPQQAARKIFKGIIGVSRHTLDGARLAEKEGADYIGCGPVFPTKTKKLKRDVIHIEGYLKIKKSVNIPVIPVGGINTQNISLLKNITRIVAVSSAINLSEDPVTTVKNLKQLI